MTDYTNITQLEDRIRRRIARDNATISIIEEEWNSGFGSCDTCSWPESGFAVYADDELVWPSKEYLETFGGYIYADDKGYFTSGVLSVYGQFDQWLNGEDWDDDE